MRLWTVSSLVQIMACRQSSPNHYLNQCWNTVNWTFMNVLQWNFNRNSNIFIQQIAFQNVVCKMASILSRPHWVKHRLTTPKMTQSDVPLQANILSYNSLQWRHNGRDSVSNHQPHDCLLNRLFRRRSKKTSKLRVTGLCAGNSPGTVEFPAQMASNAENVSIWWRHHVLVMLILCFLSLLGDKLWRT